MKTFEIFWRNLTKESQKEMIKQGFKLDNNINLAPLAIIEQEEDVE
jgi:hypothetical protein